MDRKIYNLTPAQAIMFLSMKYSLKKQVINIPTSMLIREELDFDILQQAVKYEIKRNDALRLRFEKSANTAVQYFESVDEAEDKACDRLDFTGKTEEEQNRVLSELAGRAFKIYREKPFEIVMIKSFDGNCGLFFNVNHLIMDSFAVMIFYKDVFEIYYSLKDGRKFPEPLTPYEEVLKKELAYQGSEAEKADIKFFEDLFTRNPEPLMTTPYGREPLRKARKKNPEARSASIFSLFHTKVKQKVFYIPQQQAEELFCFCKEYRVPFQCLFTMGIRTYLSLKNDHETDISLNATVARRATLAEKNSGGTRIHFFPNRSNVKDEDTFLDAVRQINGYQNACFRHINLDPQKILKIRSKIYGTPESTSYEAMSLTYQPVEMDIGTDAEIKSKWHSPGYASNPLYITIMHNFSKEKGLDVYYEYQVKLLSEEDIISFQNTVLKTMYLGIKNPQITVAEIFRELL